MAYHVSPNGPSLCHAKQGRCPYGADGENHFATVEQAATFYEEKMAATFGDFEKIKKTNTQRRKERTYALRDRFVSLGYAVKASAPVKKAARAVQKVKDTPQNVVAKVQAIKNNAWRHISKIANVSRELSNEAAAASKVVRARYSAYTAKVRDENAKLLSEWQAQAKVAEAAHAAKKEVEATYGGKLRASSPAKLQVGDRLENGALISKLKTVDGVITATTRDPRTGRFGKTLKLSEADSVNVIRPRHQVLRQIGPAYSYARSAAVRRTNAVANSVTLKARGAFDTTKTRVRQAAALQRESYNALFGVQHKVNKTLANVTQIDDVRSIHALKVS